MYSLKIRKWEIPYCNFNIRTCLAKTTAKNNLPTEVAGLHIVCGLKTIQPIDTSTHDIKTFQPSPVQTFQPIIWTVSTHTIICFDPLLPRLVIPYMEDCIRTKKTLDIIPFAQICTGGQNPLYGFARVDKKPSWFAMVDKIPFMSLQGWTKSPSEHRKK